MGNFIILSEIRTGSTHTARFLDSVHGIRMWQSSKDNKDQYEILKKTNNHRKRLTNFYSKVSDKTLGSKIPIRQINNYGMVCNFIVKKDIQPVILTRQSEVEKILSAMYAKLSGKWHQLSNIPNTKSVKVNIDDIRKKYVPMYIEEKHSMDFIREQLTHRPIIEIYYEDIVTDNGKKDLLSKLGVEWKDKYADIRNEKKLLSNPYEEYFVNFKEVLGTIKEELYKGG